MKDSFRTILSTLVGILGVIQWMFLDFTLIQRTLILIASFIFATGIIIKARKKQIVLCVGSAILFVAAFFFLGKIEDTFPMAHLRDGLYPRDIELYEKIKIDEDFDKYRKSTDVARVYIYDKSRFAGYKGESSYIFHDPEGLIMCYWIYRAPDERSYVDAHVKVKERIIDINHKNPEVDGESILWESNDNNIIMLHYHDDENKFVVGWYSETVTEKAVEQTLMKRDNYEIDISN